MSTMPIDENRHDRNAIYLDTILHVTIAHTKGHDVYDSSYSATYLRTILVLPIEGKTFQYEDPTPTIVRVVDRSRITQL